MLFYFFSAKVHIFFWMDKLIYIIQSQTLDNNYYTIMLYGIIQYSIIYENILSRSRTTCLFILFQDRMYGERYLLMTKIVKCKKYLFSSFSQGDLCPLPPKKFDAHHCSIYWRCKDTKNLKSVIFCYVFVPFQGSFSRHAKVNLLTLVIWLIENVCKSTDPVRNLFAQCYLHFKL